ncbi:MAG: Chloride channel protein, partial [Myxococcaceae bacterium]|nr:Chloride channel protein [Myxococcaceae bacterium]
LVGVVTGSSIFAVAQQLAHTGWLLAADVMQPPASLKQHDHLRHATEVMVESGLRELPVLDAAGKVVGFLDEADIARSYVDAAIRAESMA